jgi:hypothetical protein
MSAHENLIRKPSKTEGRCAAQETPLKLPQRAGGRMRAKQHLAVLWAAATDASRHRTLSRSVSSGKQGPAKQHLALLLAAAIGAQRLHVQSFQGVML